MGQQTALTVPASPLLLARRRLAASGLPLEEWPRTFAGSSASAARALSPVAAVLVERHLRFHAPRTNHAAEVPGTFVASPAASSGPCEDLPSPRGRRSLVCGLTASAGAVSKTSSGPATVIVLASVEEKQGMEAVECSPATAAVATAVEGNGGETQVEMKEDSPQEMVAAAATITTTADGDGDDAAASATVAEAATDQEDLPSLCGRGPVVWSCGCLEVAAEVKMTILITEPQAAFAMEDTTASAVEGQSHMDGSDAPSSSHRGVAVLIWV
jgi:hypothetical protein